MWKIFINPLSSRFLMRVITKPCCDKVWIFSKWLVSMPFRNVGGVVAGMPVQPVRLVYSRDTYRRMAKAMFQRHTKILSRKRQTVYCSVTDARVSGTWPLIAGTCHAAFVAASHIALSFVQGRATTPYAAIAPDPIMPVGLSLCRRSSLSLVPHRPLTNIHYVYL